MEVRMEVLISGVTVIFLWYRLEYWCSGLEGVFSIWLLDIPARFCVWSVWLRLIIARS